MKFKLTIPIITVLMAVFFQGCVSVRDVSSQSPCSELMGKRYVLQQDCYIYQTQEAGTNLFVGNASVGHFLPEQISPKFINKKIDNDVLIIGILREGTTFTIVDCTEERRPEDLFRRFKVRLESSSFQGLICDVSDLTDMSKNPPVFRDRLAKAVE